MAMAAFEELDYGLTPLGELILRRREVLSLDRAEVFEVKLDGEFLMSSIVNDAEIALAEFALPLVACDRCDVLVGGLGLGYTAKAALDAEVVVVNHHLFFADLWLKDEGVAELLPACNTVILDEAHQLAETAAQFFGETVSTAQSATC